MSEIELPSPDVYLNHLDPVNARDFEIERCVELLILGAIIWDILAYIPDDLKILSRSRFRSTIICFFLSRLLAAAFVLATAIRTTRAVSDPNFPIYTSAILCVPSIGCSSYLFLRRLHAVYADNRGVRWFFSVLWFACTMSEFAIPLGVIPGFIPGTHYYVLPKDRPFMALGVTSGIVLDTSIFLAISYKIASTNALGTERFSWNTLVSGKALPRLSRAILQSGQQYYLINIGVLIFAMTILLVPSIRPLIKNIVVAPTTPLMASMASRVFRNLKLFSFNTSATNTDAAISFHEV